MAKTEEKYEKLLATVPITILLRVAAKRASEMKQELGPYATNKTFRICPGCKKPKGAREMLAHPCKGATYRERFVFMYGRRSDKKAKAA